MYLDIVRSPKSVFRVDRSRRRPSSSRRILALIPHTPFNISRRGAESAESAENLMVLEVVNILAVDPVMEGSGGVMN